MALALAFPGVIGFTYAESTTMALAQLTDLKTYIGVTGSADDSLLSRLLESESTFFEAQCGRTFVTASYTEVRSGHGRTTMVPREDPIVSVTSVAVDGQTIPSASSYDAEGWRVFEGAIHLNGHAFTRGTGNVTLVYVAGFDPVPADVQQAVIELAALKYRDRRHIGKGAESMGGMSVTYLPSLVPASVQAVIDAYRRIIV
jgi:uncharacterized phiE125 gp8 family phage protein